MDNLSPSQFQYSGKKYTFSASLFENNMEHSIPLDNNKIEYFDYANTLNDLIIRGELVYTDSYGQLDRYLDKQYAYCQIYFSSIDQESDNNIILERESKDNIFSHIFLIDGIEILERVAQVIKYRIHLISSTIFNLLKTIDYTNYNQLEPEQIFDIIKKCVIQSKLQIDEISFNTLTTNVKLNYITNGNDNVLTIIKYLMNRLFYYQVQDNSIKFIFMNETSNKIQLFDLKDKYSSTGLYSVIISVLKDNHEALLESDPIQVGSIVKYPKHKTLQTLFQQSLTDYNYHKNIFVDATISASSMYKYYGSKIISENIVDKYVKPEILDNAYQTHNTYWNSDMATYDGLTNSLFTDNSLIINVAGEILRKPGAYVNIAIDRDETSIPDDERADTYKDQMTRYIGLEGTWITSKVKHHISPMQCKYRQSLFLFRNFISTTLAQNED